MIAGIALAICAFILGWIKKESKFTTALIVAALWVFMGLNTYNADYISYQYLYDIHAVNASGINSGYLIAEQIGWLLGLTFQQFRMFFGFIGLLLIASFVRRYSTAPNAVLVLYMLLPFMYDIVQFKFFMASAVALYSLHFLIDRSKLCFVWFTLGIVIAASIHPAAMLLLFLAIGLLKQRTAFLVSLALYFLILMGVYSGIAQYLAIFFSDSTKYEAYFTSVGRFGWIPYMISALGSLVIAELSMPSRGEQDLRDSYGSARFTRFFVSARYAFLPLAALLPLSVQNFYRPIRSANLIYFIFFVSLMVDGGWSINRQERTMLIILSLFWFIFTQIVLYQGVIELVLVTELTNNLLW